MKTLKLAKLTKAEDALYCSTFADYCNNVRNDAGRADRKAWRTIKAKFPRLQSYDGCQP